MHCASSSMDGGCFCFCLDFGLIEKSNCPVVTLPLRNNQSPSNEIRGPKTLFIFDLEIEIFFKFRLFQLIHVLLKK